MNYPTDKPCKLWSSRLFYIFCALILWAFLAVPSNYPIPLFESPILRYPNGANLLFLAAFMVYACAFLAMIIETVSDQQHDDYRA